MTQTPTPDEARKLGREHGLAVPDSPASIIQARSDLREALRGDLAGADEAAQAAYLDGHCEGQDPIG